MIIILLICLLFALFVGITVIRNQLIASRNLVNAAFADIDTLLVKRQELIPRLVQIAQSYSVYETDVLVKLVEQRTDISAACAHSEQVINSLNLVKENYPDLKADDQFQRLFDAIQTAENQLLYARRFYNGTVENYNRLIATIPHSFFSAIFGHSSRQYVSANEQQQEIHLYN